MSRCIDCKKLIKWGKRCAKCSILNYRKTRRTFKVINCPHKEKDNCTNNEGKGFRNPQALRMHIQWKHNLTFADKLASKGIETTREKPKEKTVTGTYEVKKEPIKKEKKKIYLAGLPEDKEKFRKEMLPKLKDVEEVSDDDDFFGVDDDKDEKDEGDDLFI